MSNISTIATYLARVSGQLQPMLEKVQGMDRRTFLLEAAALLALTSCSEPSGKAGMAPMISFKPSGVPVVKRSPRQLLAECNVRPMFMPRSSPLRQRSSRMKPRFITMHNTENPSADAMQHARALNNGALRCNWHYTVDRSSRTATPPTAFTTGTGQTLPDRDGNCTWNRRWIPSRNSGSSAGSPAT